MEGSMNEEKPVSMVSNEMYNKFHMPPLDKISGFDVRPGFYDMNGATAIPTGVNFTIHSKHATSVTLLLFHSGEKEPFVELPFPETYRIGNVYSMIVFDLDITDLEYAYKVDGPYDPKRGYIFDKTKLILDPYAKAVAGQADWGTPSDYLYHARVVKNTFDWGDAKQPIIPSEDVVIYETHVRGFSIDKSSGLDDNVRGTFEGIRQKIPYLKDLGITAVELMPVFEFDEMLSHRDFYGRPLCDYWGYNTVCYFAPNTSYASTREHNHEGEELKRLIKELNENNIEVYLDVVFNHTAEGNEKGPFFSFKGLDNNIYYMLTPDGYYYNFSGCGNTMNCNHPIVQEMIVECLRYWVTEYRVDGFRFDLATILGRNEDGSPMANPPLLQRLAYDPILGDVKLIAEAWDAGGMYQVGSFPSYHRWKEWNGKYRDDMRSFLKGDGSTAGAAAQRIIGSPDLYSESQGSYNASINFLDCHDGFTLHDLYTYNEKHNEDNNWNNTDGDNNNHSWNCGFEGETTDEDVIRLRKRMIKNAFATLMCSRGTPMFLMGDEFGNSQGGNNNAYCQDNNISWLNWNDLDENKDQYDFFKYMIHFRLRHPAIRKKLSPSKIGLPDVSVHGTEPFRPDYGADSHYLGIMFAGSPGEDEHDDIVYVAINTFWNPLHISLPTIQYSSWKLAVDTFADEPVLDTPAPVVGDIVMQPRSVKIFVAD